jgi:beta-galactosidase
VLPQNYKEAAVTLYYNNIGREQSIYINGNEIAASFKEGNKDGYSINTALLHAGSNSFAVVATPLLKKHEWDNINTDPGLFQVIFPAAPWKRKLFSGLAQVIIQATGEPGEVTVTASANGLKGAAIKMQSIKAKCRPAVAVN